MLICGGSCFYLECFFHNIIYNINYELYFDTLNKVKLLYKKYGLSYLIYKLNIINKKKFINYYIDLKNPIRVINALTKCIALSKNIKKDIMNNKLYYYKQKFLIKNFYKKFCLLTQSKKNLYYKIKYRINLMFKKGFIEEVFLLLKNKSFCNNKNIKKSIGYKEIIHFIKKNNINYNNIKFIDIKNINKLKKKIYFNTIHLVKKQNKWFDKKIKKKNYNLVNIDYKFNIKDLF